MATIKNTITLQDRMSPVLTAVQRSLSATMTAMAGVDKVSNSAFTKAQKEVQKLDEEIKKFNRDLDEIPTLSNKAKNSFDGWQANLMGINSLLQIAKATMESIGKLTAMSDEMVMTTARLNIMNDGLQTTQELQDKIFYSAQRARGAYQDTADAVSKMGLLAGDAFSSNDEVIMFMEQINKQFAIAGTETMGQKAAMLQLTQAMGQGVLRGQELNSIFEQVPTVIQTIADYLDVPIGKIREMASQGQITSDVVKNAMLSMADETDARFEQMPKTFGNAWTSVQNTILMNMQPIFDKMSELANSPEFMAMINHVLENIVLVINMIAFVFDIASTAIGFLTDILGPIAPLLDGIIVALIAFATISMTVAAATKLWAWSQLALNAAMNANPIWLLISAIVGLIFMIYKLWTTNLDFKYGFLNIWNSILDGLDWVTMGFTSFGAGVMNIFDNLYAFVARSMQNMVNDAINEVNKLIGIMNKIPGVSIDALNQMDFGDKATKNAEGKIASRNAELQRMKMLNEANQKQRRENTANKRAAEEAAIAAKKNETDAMNSGLGGATGAGLKAPDLKLKGGKLDSVGKIEDDINLSEEDIKLLKDVAAVEFVNKFTTLNPNVSVNFGDVHENADVSALPGVIEKMIVDALATNLD